MLVTQRERRKRNRWHNPKPLAGRNLEEYELIFDLLPVKSPSQLLLNEDEVREPPERFAIILTMSQS